jgi:ABC-2 type transport system permease protein
MNNPSNTVPESPMEPQPIAPAAMSATRSFYWSVRRELWENRSIYIAPLIVAGLALFGYAISAIGLPHRRRALLLLDPAKQRSLVEQPYDVAAMMLMLTAFLVGVFYCLDALHGERRDRSILFWKSLPVSDLTTVLSKAIIPLVVMPLLTFAIVVITQVIILCMSTAILLPAGLGATTWERLPFFQMSVVLVYGLITMALWQAPFYAWLLLVSGWARRATFLWASLPWLAVCMVEKIAFNTTYFATMLGHRMMGSYEHAFVFVKGSHGAVIPVVDRLNQLDPLKFLSSPGLWIGLLIAAGFLIAAIRLRRYRGPL